eukprot:PhM_4_TR15619/c0_g1_i5/m.68420
MSEMMDAKKKCLPHRFLQSHLDIRLQGPHCNEEQPAAHVGTCAWRPHELTTTMEITFRWSRANAKLKRFITSSSIALRWHIMWAQRNYALAATRQWRYWVKD